MERLLTKAQVRSITTYSFAHTARLEAEGRLERILHLFRRQILLLGDAHERRPNDGLAVPATDRAALRVPTLPLLPARF